MPQAKGYCDDNKLKKKRIKHIVKIPVDTTTQFEGCYVEPNSFVRNLEVHVNRCMGFESYVDNIYKKVTGRVIYRSNMKNKILTDLRIFVVQTLAN